MVVDDDADTVESLSTLLEMLGHDARGARSGREAIALASSFDPHVVLLDIALPDMSGYEVARAIRDASGRRRFLVAATGYAQERDRRLALESGFDQHLAKPMTADSVRSLMRTAARYL
jgi:CheY-like chemotaxis protein